MVRGSRHSKNAGTMCSEAITYAEKRAMGYGIMSERLGKESMSSFCDCRLTLQPTRDPVCTPNGIIFSKEVILESLLRQRHQIKRKIKIWLDLKQETKLKRNERLAFMNESKLIKFEEADKVLNNRRMTTNETDNTKRNQFKDEEALNTIDRCYNVNSIQRDLKSFWMDTKANLEEQRLFTLNAENIELTKPKSHTICPITGERLELNDLVSLKFSSTTYEVGNSALLHFIDPITKDPLTNRSNLVCIRPTGHVVLAQTYKTMIEPVGTYEHHRLKKSDIILLKRGGTGFANHDGKKIIASEYTTLGLRPNVTSKRGQHSGSGAKSGLVIF